MAQQNPLNVFQHYVITGTAGAQWAQLAYDIRNKRYVALKFVDDPTVQNAKKMVGLDHKNIVTVYDAGEAEGKHFLVTKYVEGEQIGLRQLPEGAALTLLLSVCDAVDFANKRGVVHGNLNPQNALVDSSGNVFVADFGVPETVEHAQNVAFKAPEIVEGKPPLPQTDVFSVAALLYQLLTGKNPFEISAKDDTKTAVKKVKSGKTTSIRKYEPGISKELEAVAKRGTALNPQDRYPNVAELAQDLRRYQMGYPVSAYSTGTTYRIRKAIVRNRKIAATVLAGIILALLVIYLAFVK